MVTSHVETLIERVTGVVKAVPDGDGDYPVRYRDALYYVRITGTDEQPLVRVVSSAVFNITASAELYEAINEVNTHLGFCRCFFLDGRVVIETEHLGMTIRTDDFRELTLSVAAASAYFGSMLNERFGGRLPFDADVNEEEAKAVPTAQAGLYL